MTTAVASKMAPSVRSTTCPRAERLIRLTMVRPPRP